MKNVWTNIKRFYPFFKESKKEIRLVLILSIISTIISVILPSLNGNIINNILSVSYKSVIVLALLIGILQLIYTLINILISKFYLSFRKNLILNIRKKACNAVLNLNMNEYYQKGQGSIINRVKNDSRNIATYLNNIKDSFLVAIGNIGILFYVTYLNPIIGVFYFAATLMLIYIHYYGIKKSIYYKNKSFEINDENTTLLGEVIKGARDIKSLKLKKEFASKTNNSFEYIGDLEYKSSMYIEYTNKITRFIEACCSGVMILIAVVLIKNGLLTTSNFILIFMYKNSIFNFSNRIAGLINNYSQFNLSADRIFSILNYQEEDFGKLSIEKYNGNITLENVDFSYEDNNVLNNFNLKIEKNSFVAIVGKSGAGKSTILSLINKILIPKKGKIYLDDYDIQEVDEDSIRDNISLVTQQPYIFNLSIKENLDMINDNFEKIKEICKQVELHEKIMSLESGYETKLNEDGSNLSGGEKQKLSLARVLLSNTKVILLDEITSNLDNKSSASISKLVESLKGQYTIVMVTHNIDLARKADRIIVLDNGSIVGDGSHKKLLAENNIYKELYKGIK